MHYKQTLGFALTSAILFTATQLNAIPPDPCDTPPPPVCCLEPEPGPFAFAYPYDMDLNCPRDFYFHVDGLAFQAKQDGMDFAIQDSTRPDATNPITHGRTEGFSGNTHHWDWQPGARVGFGFYLNHDAWNLDFNWTWLNITSYEHGSSSTPGGVVIPLWISGRDTLNNQIGPDSSAKWDASYNTLDIRMGKPYYVSRYLVFNPHFGARGACIDQHFSVDYGGVPGAGENRTIHHGDNDFWGVGARFGVDTDWILGKGWKLFGNVAASMLFGKFKIDQNMNEPISDFTGDGYDLRYAYFQNQPNVEIAMGIAWGYYFNKMRNHVGLKVAYEFHEWWDQLNMRRFFSGQPGYSNDVVSRGNFTLNGVSVCLRLDI